MKEQTKKIQKFYESLKGMGSIVTWNDLMNAHVRATNNPNSLVLQKTLEYLINLGWLIKYKDENGITVYKGVK